MARTDVNKCPTVDRLVCTNVSMLNTYHQYNDLNTEKLKKYKAYFSFVSQL